ncbi:hypothetical protein SAMN04488514_11623 [Kriegella aquimaris]|uniref:Uncharacterized protein n=1 Tax=Kriegella aquimaris TaxID=192904 RepID=A0A1G9WQZ0_9FLAO|nr:hypothetical protein SAMN04488514_11623 [Kriegella aquimaris]
MHLVFNPYVNLNYLLMLSAGFILFYILAKLKKDDVSYILNLKV